YQPKVGLPLEEARPMLLQEEPQPVPAAAPSQEDIYKQRAEELENELKSISEKAEAQSGEAKQMIQTLTEENESLKLEKAKMELAQQKLGELQGEASALKTENTQLQTQLGSANARMQQLEQEMAAFKVQMGQEIEQARATVAQLTQEKEGAAAAPAPEPAPAPDEGLRRELESLKSEQAELRQKCEELGASNQKLQELNTQLTEKVDGLEYELVKARAQASGLERISSNYKNQLEDSLKKLNAIQVTHDHLCEAKGQLEGVVEEIKLHNEELAKKDQLAQFELEKSRSRLVNLERECEDLKAKVQQTEQGQ
ncbi:MAG: hypothetical protein KGJ11_05505, partial [Candidatus Omnitrophica bacterium]|nr:hypothetical protein [Candidatus Omnitrophota bacterium]